MNERLLNKGKLLELRNKQRELDLQASAMLVTIRTILNPYEESLTLIDTEKALIMMQKLHESVTELKKINTHIKNLEENLYG